MDVTRVSAGKNQLIFRVALAVTIAYFNTFVNEIPYHLIRKLQNKILFFMQKYFWYILCFILFVCVVGYVVYQTFYNNNHDYISNVGLIFGALSLVWGTLTSLGVFPKLKKTSRYDD